MNSVRSTPTISKSTGDGGATDNKQQYDAIANSAVAKASWRILPLIGLGYLFSYMDRVNISFAAAQMNEDLQFSATVYGLGGGLFFLSYAAFEIPSNLLLVRFGARRWIARIMVTWGLLAAGMMFVRTPMQFYVMRFLLGFAEAGFFPGVIFYLSSWFPSSHRGRVISRFYCVGALTSVVMGLMSAWLLDLDGRWDLRGWQWLFLIQGLPAVLVGVAIFLRLPDTPRSVKWLTPAEKDYLQRELLREAALAGEHATYSVFTALRHPLVLQLGGIGFLTIGSYVTFVLSTPALLAGATGLDMRHVGYVVSIGGVLGTLGMLLSGWLSDRRGDRFTYLLGSTVLLAGAYFVFGIATSPVTATVAYLVIAAVWTTVTLSTWMVTTDVLHVRLLAVGSAAINSMSQLGAFIAPYAWGASKDATGTYAVGMLALPIATLIAVAMILILRRQLQRCTSH
jgi:ACS family tartrate transporter-like MFS transporter